ncbi:MAG: ATP-binding protein [Nocardiopsaceae bacterium]|nr:ATP-binding protein [Nocardiopsaceae bacterium]
MAKTPTYAEALKILGQDDSAVLDFAEKLVDGGLGALGVPDLFGLRSEIVHHGRSALTAVRDRLTGVSRRTRTERIMAAHRIVVATSLLEAVNNLPEEPGFPLGRVEENITADELQDFIETVLNNDHHRPVLFTLPGVPVAQGRFPIDDFGQSADDLGERLAELFTGFVERLGAWKRLTDDEQADVYAFLDAELADGIAANYAESYRRLAADVPEFGVWANMAEHHGTQARLDTVAGGLAKLHGLMADMASGRPVDRRREELAAAYRSVLRRPLLRSADAPTGFSLPLMEAAYLAPRGRIGLAAPGCRPSADDWWNQRTLHEDLQPVLASFLTHPRMTEVPLVILGHPGAGKSKLTEMLAARLPASDFLALRVELRSVQPNAPIHAQIDEGIAAALHTRVSWRDLADSADGALPVVILDGFDELLQATGVNRSDYLEQVRDFQLRQAELGQPVAVVVTSRTVVADRARFPDGTPIIRLEPFSQAQIAQMLDIWSRANADALAARGLKAPTPPFVLAYPELAEQPLLLLMLLIYDADDNALQRAGDGLSRSGLYEHLLTMFAQREVRKHRPHLDGRDMGRAVEDELHRLEIVAIAMFARQRQTVTAEELEQDLAVLLPDAAVRPADAGMHGAVSDAHQVLGRFFFVHEAQARVDSGTASVFEFLHATFGEFLTARAVTAALEELVADRRHAARRRFAAPLDDGLFYALTSFAALAGSAATVQFTEDLLARRFTESPNARLDYRELLVELIREALDPPANRSFGDYRPQRIPITTRQGAYTANLITLLVLVADEEIDLTELYPDVTSARYEWRSLVGLWRALHPGQWFGILSTVRLRYLGYWGGEPRIVVQRENGDPVNVGECVGFELRVDVTNRLSINDPYQVTVPYESVASRLLRSMALRVNGTACHIVLMLLPYLRHVSADLGEWFLDNDTDTAWAEVPDILELRLAPATHDPDTRIRRYVRLLSTKRLGRLELLVLRQAAEDLHMFAARQDTDRFQALYRTVHGYLMEVADLVPGPAVAGDNVTAVLAMLGPHMDARDPQLREKLRWIEERADALPVLTASAQEGADAHGRDVADAWPSARTRNVAARPVRLDPGAYSSGGSALS